LHSDCLRSPSRKAINKEYRTSEEPLWSQADAYYDAEEMARSREDVLDEGGAQPTYYVLFNQLEAQSADGRDDLYWNGQAWYGGDINKIWFKTEGKSSLNDGDVEDANYRPSTPGRLHHTGTSRAGVRHDFKPDSLDYAVIGVQGLAPYFFEIDVSAFLSTEGNVSARAEIEYDLLLTQRLILQPRIEANLSLQDVPERMLGAGLNNFRCGSAPSLRDQTRIRGPISASNGKAISATRKISSKRLQARTDQNRLCRWRSNLVLGEPK